MSPSISQLTSVFSCPAGMSTIWMAEMVPSLPPRSTLRPSPVQFVSSLSSFPKPLPPTFPGTECQYRERKEKLHVSQEYDKKEFEMKVEVDPPRGFEQKESESGWVRENKLSTASLTSATTVIMVTAPRRTT